MFPAIADLQEFVREQLEIAVRAASQINFSLTENYSEHYQKKATMLQSIPRFSRLEAGYGTAVWAAVLFVDLRKSTDRASRLGPKNTYLTVHALLPALTRIVECSSGVIANFRGDGLFAVFGINKDGNNSPDFDLGKSTMTAVRCGKAMLETVTEAINPVLAEFDLEGELNIGVGIDKGKIVITRVGLAGANEVTAYGDAVNHAAKYCGGNGVMCISHDAWNVIPGERGGKLTVKPVELMQGVKALKVVYPPGIRVLRASTKISRSAVGR